MSAKEPKISVVIPSYNSERWVVEAVDSALAQTRPPHQIVVIDDGSKDRTSQVLAPYVQRGVDYVYQANSGVAAARNAGIARSTGEYVAFLDADDVWHPRKLELQSAILSQRPDLGMLGSGTFSWPGEMPTLNGDGYPLLEIPWRSLIVRNYFTTSSILARRSAIDAAGPTPFDTNLHGPEDFDLWLRIAEISGAANLDAPLTGYREVHGSLGKQVITMEAGVRRILNKAGQRGAWKRPGGNRLRRKAYAHFHYTCAYMHGAAGSQRKSVTRNLLSMALYPMPFEITEIKKHFARPKLLAVALLRMAGLKELEQGAGTTLSRQGHASPK